MKKSMKKVFALMIMAAVIMISAVPALAGITYDKTMTVYLTPSRNVGGFLYVRGLTGSQRLKKSDIKSSNPSVAKLGSVDYSTYKSNTYGESSTYIDKYSRIMFGCNKPGTSTISFKVGSKTYKSKVTIRKYVNPLSSLTITGINGGKSIHRTFNKENECDYKFNKTVSNARIRAKARDGWYISALTIYHSGNRYSTYNIKNDKTISALNLRMPKFGKGYSLQMVLLNKSNGGDLELDVYFG